jgi:hypothetical protein
MRPRSPAPARRHAAPSDRAFRALARAEPEVIAALLSIALPRLVPRGARVTPEEVDDPNLEAADQLVEADWIARMGRRSLVHAEFQGYRDATFLQRLLRYHLALVLRYGARIVRTVAIWSIRPPASQRVDRIVAGSVTFAIDSVVLPELSADRLLADPLTVCFAAGADAGALGAEELCARVVAGLCASRASPERWRVAMVGAGGQGRYKEMVKAMQQVRVETPIIEDLVKIGEDIGYRRGRRRGRERGRVEGARGVLLGILAARRIRLREGERERIDREASVERLSRWAVRAATARGAAEVFAEE